MLQVRLALEIIFEGVQGASDMGSVQGASPSGDVLCIADMLTLSHQPASQQVNSATVTLEWEAGPMGDMLADAITAVILQVMLCLLGSVPNGMPAQAMWGRCLIESLWWVIPWNCSRQQASSHMPS